MPHRAIGPNDFVWITRPHDPGEPARHVAELSERAGFAHTRANVWRYEPGAKGRRHRHTSQEETFVVLAGTLSIYVGEAPERIDVPTGGADPYRARDSAAGGEPRCRGARRLRLRLAARGRARRDPRLGV